MSDEEHSLEEKEAHKGKRKPWTLREFGGKTIWDWMGLLIVPVVLSLITFVFAWQQDIRQDHIENKRAKAERELAVRRAQDEALQAYLDQMGSLLLERDLRTSKEDSEVRTLARARTLTVLGRLDPSRKTAVMQFLAEAKLLQKVEGRGAIITFSGADLSGANLTDAADNLSGADLSFANLSGANLTCYKYVRQGSSGTLMFGTGQRCADLSGADLSGADLGDADLSDANLSGADLEGANISGANLMDAKLSRADLLFAYLGDADLSGANLSGADLKGANISGAQKGVRCHPGPCGPVLGLPKANLRKANLSGAEGITNEELEQQAASLEGATMPNGQKYEDWFKDREAPAG